MAVSEEIVDLLVIGGGTAGIVGAQTAASLGASTVLVESGRTGGDCLWTGCVPSKAILAVAPRAKIERELTGEPPNFAVVRDYIAQAIRTIEPVDSPAALQRAGVTVRSGSARFTAPGLAEIDGRAIAYRQALIATGAEPLVPAIPGLKDARFVTSETVWELSEVPRRFLVIGGGPVSCELAQAFSHLGSEVTMLVRSHLLPKEDRDAAALVRQSLESDGVRILENAPVERISVHDGASRAHLAGDSHYDGEVVLVATGRKPRTAQLGLENVGVTCDSAGHVQADAKMRTSNPNIWTAGDVTAGPQFTHLAGVQASVAASNAVLGTGRSVSATIPRVTYTSPELAAVGITGTEDGRYQASTVQHSDIDRGVTDRRANGLTRLIIGRRGRILGGTIVGPRAGESLAELTLAVEQGHSARDIAGTTHAYPTYSDGVWNAAIAHTRSQLSTPAMSTALKVLVHVRRWRLDRQRARHRNG